MGLTQSGRKLLAAANFKANVGCRSEVYDYVARLNRAFQAQANVEVCMFPPTHVIYHLRRNLSMTAALEINVGAQKVHWAEKGAFTGECTVPMLRDLGAHAAIVGHSEHRTLFGESNESAARRAAAALAGGLQTIFCIGENELQRDASLTKTILSRQLEALIPLLEVPHLSLLEIAYEPVWAIGTGRTPAPSEVEDVHRYIRELLTKCFPKGGEEVRILYGGSVTTDNVATFVARPHVNGALVGGASLNPEGWCKLVEAMQSAIG